MNEYTYILFGESGNIISKLLKKGNKKTKIIHFCETYMKDNSSADLIVNLDYDFMGCIANEFAYYEELIENEEVKSKIKDTIKDIKNVIIIHDSLDDSFCLSLEVSKMLFKNKANCINIFCEPFKFVGKKRLEKYKEFFTQIIKYGKCLYFSCEKYRNKFYKKMSILDVFDIIYEIQYNISISLNSNIDDLCKKTINKYNELYSKKISEQLIIFVGGCGSNIASKYNGDLKTLYISNYFDRKRKKISQTIIVNSNSNYLDNGGINYKSHIEDYKNKEKEIIKYLENIKEVLIVCGLGGLYGSAGLIYLSNLCKNLNIKTTAIISLPFKFEGNARIIAAKEALEKSKCDELIKIDMEKYREYITYTNVEEGTICNYFNNIDKLFTYCIEEYESCYLDKKRLYGKKFHEVINNKIEENIKEQKSILNSIKNIDSNLYGKYVIVECRYEDDEDKYNDYVYDTIFGYLNKNLKDEKKIVVDEYSETHLKKGKKLLVKHNEINYKNIISIDLYPLPPEEEGETYYTYVSVVYDDDIVATTIGEPSFYYKTNLDNIAIGDKVLVDRQGKDVVGIVVNIEYFSESGVPFPLDKTKDIIKII